MNPWLLALRPKTLSAAVVPVLIGSALASHIDWLIFAFALSGALFIQIGTNFVNDALDYKKGADTSERLGPIRVTQAGLLNADVVLRAAFVCFALAASCGVPLIIRGGWPIAIVGVASIIAAYAYTGGPYPLAYNGLGELFVMIFFGFVAVGGSYYVQMRSIDAAVVVAGFAAGSGCAGRSAPPSRPCRSPRTGHDPPGPCRRGGRRLRRGRRLLPTRRLRARWRTRRTPSPPPPRCDGSRIDG